MIIRWKVLEMFLDEDAETHMLAMTVKFIVHCLFQLNADEGFTAVEAIEMSVDKESVA